jgi:hypothetical protein
MNLDELARHQKTIQHFRWMPGMKTVNDDRVIAIVGDELVIDQLEYFEGCGYNCPTRFERRKAAEELPDLTDPATLGCLLHLVREAWGDHRAVVTYCDEGWRFEVWNSDNFFPDWPLGKCFPTEAEALVEAAEAAS